MTKAPPAITFETLTFSDGTVIELGADDTVVFVGPNNSGKSAALRDLDELIQNPSPGSNPKLVIKSVQLRREGSVEDVLELLETHFKVFLNKPGRQFVGLGTTLMEFAIGPMWQG